MPKDLRTTTFEVAGMDCAGCARKIEQALRAVDGVIDVSLHHPETALGVLHEPRVTSEAIGAAVTGLGFAVTPAEPTA